MEVLNQFFLIYAIDLPKLFFLLFRAAQRDLKDPDLCTSNPECTRIVYHRNYFFTPAWFKENGIRTSTVGS